MSICDVRQELDVGLFLRFTAEVWMELLGRPVSLPEGTVSLPTLRGMLTPTFAQRKTPPFPEALSYDAR
jgi:hypothetical protein